MRGGGRGGAPASLSPALGVNSLARLLYRSVRGGAGDGVLVRDCIYDMSLFAWRER